MPDGIPAAILLQDTQALFLQKGEEPTAYPLPSDWTLDDLRATLPAFDSRVRTLRVIAAAKKSRAGYAIHRSTGPMSLSLRALHEALGVSIMYVSPRQAISTYHFAQNKAPLDAPYIVGVVADLVRPTGGVIYLWRPDGYGEWRTERPLPLSKQPSAVARYVTKYLSHKPDPSLRLILCGWQDLAQAFRPTSRQFSNARRTHGIAGRRITIYRHVDVLLHGAIALHVD